ncbi:AAA family ATPase [Thiocapsa rosea]|uniref:Uncharacterized protein DUF3696 n=1 Tax=Thiocapsa rosea TaxID=69360 RepID=A0A495VBC5_9GAMM|nr:DUF3696 domain-containing protein [Thiocapsa rosea]RKT46652.1 uncharacterized protein DUF3696 [Thiocapsa rosea]
MILKALTLENFKGFREPVRVKFAPLTLLFGPNNAGKSSIVQALMYAREVLERNNCDSGQTQLGGDIVDLGGFQNLVYGHDLNRVIRMRFELDLSDIELPRHIDWVKEFGSGVGIEEFADKRKEEIFDSIDEFLSKTSDIWVEIHIGCFKPTQFDASAKPTVQRYLVGRGVSDVYAEISLREDGTTAITKLSFGKSPFGYTCLREDGTPVGDYELLELFDGLIGDGSVPVAPDKALRLRLHGTAIPEIGKLLDFSPSVWMSIDKEGKKEGLFHNRAFEEERLKDLLTRFITGPAELLQQALQNSVYVSPFREMPPRHYQPARSPDTKRWANGLAAWDLLLLEERTFAKQVNNWLTDQKKFNSGYSIDVRHYRELEIDSDIYKDLTDEEPKTDLDLTSVRSTLLNLAEGRRLSIRDHRSGISLFPQDLGVGISQLIPVIVAALHTTSGIVAIEEPESNIHPAFQVVLGDLFITQANSNPDVMFLVETHSEHLMLRCLRRIRETTEEEIPAGAPSLRPDDVAVHFVSRNEQGSRIDAIHIDVDGDFTDPWPSGFFRERAKELFG